MISSTQSLQLTILDSIEQLTERAAEWDGLWLRSDVALPTARAALLAQWVEQFAPGATFRALLVEDHGQLVAALPLVGMRIKGVVEVGMLPSNHWTPSGELLVDRECDRTTVIEKLLEGFDQLPWSLLCLRFARRDAPAWRTLADRCQAAGLSHFGHDQFDVGVVELKGDFPAFEATWSGNHRRHMGKARRRLEREGGGDLQVYSSLKPDEVEPLLLAGFQLEDQSWKGAEGTSVLKTPGMFDFLCRQAEQLAACRQLHLTFLTQRGWLIAFEYGSLAKGRYFTPKVAFDPAFSQFTPSQVLRYELYQKFSGAPSPPTIDFHGPISDATSKWITDRYTVGTTLVALRPVVGRALLNGYRWLRAARKKTKRAAAV